MKVIDYNGTISECLSEDEEQIMRHTAAHILAQAMSRLYPHAKFGYGPATEHGFYYDVDLGEEKLSEEDLRAIQEEMSRIVKANLPIRPFILPREEAKAFLMERGEDYKAEHLDDLPVDADISFFRQGEYVDMCTGPHLCHTKGLKAFQLTGQSGAYWKNDRENKMLTRIKGIAFSSQTRLKEYLHRMEEAERRDHRRIGKEMELFLLTQEAPGFPFFLAKGMTVRNALIGYWRELHIREGYQEISTPLIMERGLWETSGHWDHYKDNMYTTSIDEMDFCVKPMNCPGSVLVYRSQPHSYRDLPLRLAELGVVHRHEMRGALHGLFRVRCFTQDDAHIFLRREQIREELQNIIRMIDQVYQRFGFRYHVELSTRPEDSMGSEEDWQAATEGLVDALDNLGLPYRVNEGDGAFYGPKIDFHLEDCIGRTWQCGTIQLDFQIPRNFDLQYVDERGQFQRPIMIHRVCFGSLERFLGILTEHYSGKFPVWMAPVQVKVLPISEKHRTYGKQVYETLRNSRIRCELDDRNEKIGYRIREAQQIDRVPYMLVVGKQEEESGTVSLRTRDSTQVCTLSLEEFAAKIKAESRTK